MAISVKRLDGMCMALQPISNLDNVVFQADEVDYNQRDYTGFHIKNKCQFSVKII